MTEMTPAEAVYFAAAALPAADRPAYLARVCAGDADLRRRVEGMLAVGPEVGDFLEPAPPPADAATASFPGPAAADTTATGHSGRGERAGGAVGGRYTLVEPIGEGGMGTVWMAEQREPVRRLVAVKLIKPGMDSQQVLVRFAAERQALALMDHPNIAKILDAGTADDGRPFFVMELVKGVPIAQFCDDRTLTPRERLALFVPVCQAVQHAHQKGVIHRDLKPGNILVALYDDRPVPKVIDFGVAKAVGTQLTDQTLHTGFGAVVGTPEYMSPEQATFNNLDVDTRTDVYALGVVLYELLTGSPPFRRKELQSAGLAEMLRVIREVEPPKPSTKISTADALPSIAANRKTEPKALTGLVRGELDWIVMKALEKDRRRRYESAAGLAKDVERYLAGDSVEAAPPSRAYRVRKFVRRHRPALAVATAFGLLLVAATAVSVVLALRAERAKSNAQGLAVSLRRVLETADPQAGGGGPFTVRKLLDEYAATLEQDAAGQPEVEADLRLTIGRAYMNVDAAAQALPQLERAVALRRQHLGPRHSATAEALTSLARAKLVNNWAEHSQTADLIRTAKQSEEHAIEAADILRAAPDAPKEWLVRALLIRCWAIDVQEKHGGRRTRTSEGYAREALALAERLPGDQPTRLTTDAAVDVAYALGGQGREAEERAALERAREYTLRAYPEKHPLQAQAAELLGLHYGATGRLAEGERLMKKAAELNRAIHGDEPHIDSLRTANFWIGLLHEQFRDAEAAAVVADLPKAWEGKEYAALTVGRRNLSRAGAHVARGDFVEAERFAAAVFDYKGTTGEQSEAIRREALQARALALSWLGRGDEVAGLLADERERLRPAVDRLDDSVVTLPIAHLFLEGPAGFDHLARCETLCRRWLDKTDLGPKSDRGCAHAMIAWALQSRGEYEKALAEWPQAMALLAPTGRPPGDMMLVRGAYVGRSQAYAAQGDFAKAEGVLREAVDRNDGLDGHPELAYRRCHLAHFLLARGRPAEADAELKEACRLLAAHPQARSDSLTRRWRLAAASRGVAAAVALWHRVRPYLWP